MSIIEPVFLPSLPQKPATDGKSIRKSDRALCLSEFHVDAMIPVHFPTRPCRPRHPLLCIGRKIYVRVCYATEMKFISECVFE